MTSNLEGTGFLTFSLLIIGFMTYVQVETSILTFSLVSNNRFHDIRSGQKQFFLASVMARNRLPEIHSVKKCFKSDSLEILLESYFFL